MATDTPHLTGLRALAALADLGFASIAAGVLARRRNVVRALERIQADKRAVTRMHKLRAEFDGGPVELRLPGRRYVVITDPEEVGQVLEDSPNPFHPANIEKRKALQWFQPHGVLISRGPIREQRRALNEAALETASEIHSLAGDFVTVIREEADRLSFVAVRLGHLDSTHFMAAWWRIVRRVTLGDSAADDEAITDQLMRLRKAGNWSFLAIPRRGLRERFTEHLYRYAETPQPGTLLHALAQIPAGGALDPVGQVPHWLFAFDAVGMASIRALALLSTHPEQLDRALKDAADPDEVLPRTFLHACMLESVRLWPTTPTILRDTIEDTEWRSKAGQFTISAGAAVMVAVPAFHRDEQLLPFAHQFTPDIWLDGRAQQHPALVPFSAGPAECPGRNLVLFLAATTMAHLLSSLRLGMRSRPTLSPSEPLPMTLNQLTIDFAVEPLPNVAAAAVTESG
ncbi:cytochrome P450 [Mycobacterium paraterrae]|uniref:Cytochrome P450 n=1 Tax=Mycobacterium paraterrae TaxID=577492 RepID=A0ABY3VHP5_9MYCO|nr:cytochrome P450 [Mycobacterium paraterrae]UMB68940.1 cytochrome P450 [Mycobacterium paraterrae]